MFGELYAIHMAINTTMGQYATSQIPAKLNLGTLLNTQDTFSMLFDWKVVYLPILVLIQWYICLCVYISVIKLIIDVPRKPSWKGPMLM